MTMRRRPVPVRDVDANLLTEISRRSPEGKYTLREDKIQEVEDTEKGDTISYRLFIVFAVIRPFSRGICLCMLWYIIVWYNMLFMCIIELE